MNQNSSPDDFAPNGLRLRIDRVGASLGVSQARIAVLAGFPPRHLYDGCLSPDEERCVEAILDLLERGEIPTFPHHRKGYRPRRSAQAVPA